jgi:hypothetical protein
MSCYIWPHPGKGVHRCYGFECKETLKGRSFPDLLIAHHNNLPVSYPILFPPFCLSVRKPIPATMKFNSKGRMEGSMGVCEEAARSTCLSTSTHPLHSHCCSLTDCQHPVPHGTGTEFALMCQPSAQHRKWSKQQHAAFHVFRICI